MLNKNGTPVRNVVVGINAGKNGYIKIGEDVVDSDTTDNNGEITFSWHDTGDADDARTDTILVSFVHPSISGTVSDTSHILVEPATQDGLVLSFQKVQPIAGGNGTSVGEAVVGSASVLIITQLVNANNQAVSDALISFSAEVNGVDYGGFDISNLKTDSDGLAVVTYSVNSGNGAVDNLSTPLFENVLITAYYSQDTQNSTRFDVYGSMDDVWPYTISMTDPTPEEITLSSETPSVSYTHLTLPTILRV